MSMKAFGIVNGVIRAEFHDGTVKTLDTQVVATSLSRRFDREEAREAIETWMLTNLPAEYRHIQVDEIAPVFWGEFVQEPTVYPPRQYIKNQTLSSLQGENVYLTGCDLQGATVGELVRVDAVGCNFDGATFTQPIRYPEFLERRCSFAGAQLPANMPARFNHGMVREALSQALSLIPSAADRTAISDVLQVMPGVAPQPDYDRSWQDSMPAPAVWPKRLARVLAEALLQLGQRRMARTIKATRQRLHDEDWSDVSLP